MTNVERKKAALGVGEDLYLELVLSSDALSSRVVEVFRGSGLTSQQYNVLRILRGAGPEGLPTLNIRERMITRVPDVTRLIDRLVKNRLVRRERCSDDRRVVRIVITEDGLSLLADLDGPLKELLQSFLTHLSGDEVDTLMTLLIKLREAVDDTAV